MKFRILGPMEIAAQDGTVVRLPGGRARIVLAVLCADAGREVSSDRLIDLAWDGNPPATSATQLHSLISSLRRAFGLARDVLVTRPDGYVLRADVDLMRMRELITFARRCLEGGNLDQAAASYGEALAQFKRATEMVRQEPGLGYLIGVFIANQAALDLHRELGGVGTDFVTALDAYGHALQALGKEGGATEAWQEAAVLAESQADPRAAQLRERAELAGGPRLP